MNTGKITKQFPIPQEIISNIDRDLNYYRSSRYARSSLDSAGGIRLSYLGDRRLLLNRRYLINLDNQAVVWEYRFSRIAFAGNSPDDRIWTFGAKPCNRNGVQYLMNPTQIPSSDLLLQTSHIKT